MFQRIIDDVRDSVSSTLRQAWLAVAAAFTLLITIAFLCAAAFIFLCDKYGPVTACLAGAGLFLIVTLFAVGWYTVRQRKIQALARQRAKASTRSLFADPMVVATGLQIARAVGVKRLLPLLAVGGLALGLLVGRSTPSDETPAE